MGPCKRRNNNNNKSGVFHKSSTWLNFALILVWGWMHLAPSLHHEMTRLSFFLFLLSKILIKCGLWYEQWHLYCKNTSCLPISSMASFDYWLWSYDSPLFSCIHVSCHLPTRTRTKHRRAEKQGRCIIIRVVQIFRLVISFPYRWRWFC